MKKGNNNFLIALLCLLLSCFPLLIGCEPPSFDYDFEWMKEEIYSVELISYDNEEKIIVYDRAGIFPIDFEKIDVIEKVEEDKIEDVIYNFWHSPKFESGVFLAVPIGLCVKMNMKDGKFLLITAEDPEKAELSKFVSMIAIFDEDGNVTDMPIGCFRGDNSYNNFIKKIQAYTIE